MGVMKVAGGVSRVLIAWNQNTARGCLMGWPARVGRTRASICKCSSQGKCSAVWKERREWHRSVCPVRRCPGRGQGTGNAVFREQGMSRVVKVTFTSPCGEHSTMGPVKRVAGVGKQLLA